MKNAGEAEVPLGRAAAVIQARDADGFYQAAAEI